MSVLCVTDRQESSSPESLSSGGIIAICPFGCQSGTGFRPDHHQVVMPKNVPQSSRHRQGDRIVAAIVVLCLAIVILMLVLPDTTARINDRRPQCLSDMRYVSTSFHAFASANNGDLPMLRGIEIENDTNPDKRLTSRAGLWPYSRSLNNKDYRMNCLDWIQSRIEQTRKARSIDCRRRVSAFSLVPIHRELRNRARSATSPTWAT